MIIKDNNYKITTLERFINIFFLSKSRKMKDITSTLMNVGKKAAVVPTAIAAGLALGAGNAYGQKSIIDYVRMLPDGKAFTVSCNPDEKCENKEYMRSGNVIMIRTDHNPEFETSNNYGWAEAIKSIPKYKKKMKGEIKKKLF